jgi:two-component system, OmpR family, sensor histidine kinase KdpD
VLLADQRPNPDEVLARVRAEESRAGRGKLKIFFGYAAGVGKTYAMLEAARREKAQGVDVVVGYVEPHGRPDTEALLLGLEQVPLRAVLYQGVTLREFDLDAALKRRPQLLLVDELAHTNAEGSRHAKRWQDIEELLAAGIDVWTTLNVQHIESLNDVIAQITSVVVRETLPDAVIDRADEIELIDITPDELAERLRGGKVYVPPQAERALQSFFQKTNLVALRELSLRETADRLQKDVEAARRERAPRAAWATRDRLLVCVGPSPTSARLIRTAKRMADALDAEWLAVVVQSGEASGPSGNRERIARHLGLAERLGAETQTLIGANVAATILDYAQTRNVTKIIIGKTARPWWKRLLGRSVVEQLLEASGNIDIYLIRGQDDGSAPAPTKVPTTSPFRWTDYAAALSVVTTCGLLGWLGYLFHLTEANSVMVFLLGVVFVAHRYGRGPAIATAILNVLVFDFFFVPPYLTFSVNDAQYLITFAVMLVIGLFVSVLTVRVQERLRASQRQERRTGALYRLTKQLSEVVGTVFLMQIAGRQLREIFGGEIVIFVRSPGEPVELRFGQTSEIAKQPVNAIVAQWVADHDQIAGPGTDTLPNATALFVPLTGSQRTVGALGVRPDDPQRFLDPEERRLLETCASLIALSIERDQSVFEAQQSKLHAEAEQMRSSLLSSVSHDLRTPLAAVAGTASSLLESPPSDPAARRELLQNIVDEARRLARLVENLLDMSRLDAGAIVPDRQWHVVEEIVGSAVGRLQRELSDRPIRSDIPADLPLVSVDGLLMEQVLVNLLENAVRYTPAGSPIEITARRLGEQVEIRVADEGPGLPAGTEQRLFEKFFRGTLAQPDSRRGVGLGLAICRGVVKAHGGTITARNRPGGGAEFLIALPAGLPPPVPSDGLTVSAIA